MSAPHSLFRWVSAAASDRGRVRVINEDAFLDRPDLGLWVVADGMGGHDAGDLASREVVQALATTPQPVFLGRAVFDLRRRLADADQRLRDEAVRRGNSVIGSTVAAMLALGGHCVLLWVGDSRVYRLRAGTLRRLSRDHSQVEELIDHGLLAREDAESHPAANIITRAVGAGSALEIDALIHRLRDGDRFLLCTDGLTKEMSEPEISAVLAQNPVKQAAHALVHHACLRGAKDNVTVVVVSFHGAYTAVKSDGFE